MDRDHAAIDLLFDAAATTADSELPALLDMIAEELNDHFAREEAMMAEARVPFLFHHFELHTQLLREIENMRREVARSDAASARQLIGVLLLRFVADHVATADAAAARFLTAAGRPPLPARSGGAVELA
jgi:hemerythrin